MKLPGAVRKEIKVALKMKKRFPSGTEIGNSGARGTNDTDDIDIVSDFRLQRETHEKNANALDGLDNYFNYHITEGDRVHENLAKAIHNRFTVKLPKA